MTTQVDAKHAMEMILEVMEIEKAIVLELFPRSKERQEMALGVLDHLNGEGIFTKQHAESLVDGERSVYDVLRPVLLRLVEVGLIEPDGDGGKDYLPSRRAVESYREKARVMEILHDYRMRLAVGGK